ncbi:MAG: Bax inhibitor-1/YccA family protein [Chloroflexi bacterium]|nr:Bax inhibitor-1/YccA family protein [Chloroflexota bacterium]
MGLFNNNSPIGKPQGIGDFAIKSSPISAVSMNSVMRLVYVWMTLGLALTAVLALFISGQIERAVNSLNTDIIWLNPAFMIGAIIAELAVVIVLSIGLSRKWLSPTAAAGLFLVYSALNGLTLSPIIWSYGQASVYKAFASTAVLFGIMSVYGYTTKSDLMGWGKYLMMALLGLIVAMVINMLLRSSAMDFVISIFGVFIFTALTAYDTQKIKVMAEDPAIQGDSNAILKVSIYGALNLYLDFINLFLYLLRLFGSSRD